MGEIIVTQIKNYPIYHFKFDTQYLLSMTFIRFQEHYESSRDYFRENSFTLEEYMDWYASEFKHFTYDKDWSGFNVPSNIIKDVRDTFIPLREKEEIFLNKMEDEGIFSNNKFYIIGTFGKPTSLNHEIAHGLFFCDEEYREKTTRIVSKFEVADLKDYLLEIGYWEGVMTDEIQAYALTGFPVKPDAEMLRLKNRLKNAVGSYLQGLRKY